MILEMQIYYSFACTQTNFHGNIFKEWRQYINIVTLWTLLG